jgi:hypothetical protein
MRQEEKRKKADYDNYVSKPFPSHKVNDFLVSKTFFAGAVLAWFSSSAWQDKLESFRNRSVNEFCFAENGLFMQYAREVHTTAHYHAKVFSSMAALRKLEIVVSYHVFDEVDGKYAWEHDLEEHELASLRISAEICRCRRLKVFKLSPGFCSFTNTAKKKETFKRNVEALENVIKKGIDATIKTAEWRDNAEKSSGPLSTVKCVPLYRRSRVCFACSSLHQSEDDSIDEIIDSMGFNRVQRTRAKTDRRLRRIRTATIPNSKNQIKKLLRTHGDRIVDYLYETKQKYNAEIAAQLYGKE